MDYRIHFKISHGGVTRRFALSRDEDDLIYSLKSRVRRITGADAPPDEISLYWKDEDSLVVLDCIEDMNAAIDFAQTQNKLACVSLMTGADQREEERKVTATKEDSSDAFDGYPMACDGCDAFLAPSNGGRFKCTICVDFELCAACFAKGNHDNHAFVHLRNGATLIPQLEEGQMGSTAAKYTHRCTPTFYAKSEGRQREAEQTVYQGKPAIEDPQDWQAAPMDEEGNRRDKERFIDVTDENYRDYEREEVGRRYDLAREAAERAEARKAAYDRERNGRGDWSRDENRRDNDRNARERSGSAREWSGRGADNRDARENRQEPARLEYYSSRYGGAEGVREQGGWQADRRCEDREQSVCERDYRNPERDEGRNGGRGRYDSERRNDYSDDRNYGRGQNDGFTRYGSGRGWDRRERGGRYDSTSRDYDRRGNDREEPKRNEKEDDEAQYAKASQIPAHMAIAVLEEMKGMWVERTDNKLTVSINQLVDNTYELQKHDRIFSDRADREDYLIGNVAVDLEKHLRNVQLEVRGTKDQKQCTMVLCARIDKLRQALRENGTDRAEYEKIANDLRGILLTRSYTRRGPIKGSWNDQWVGFMAEDPRRKGASPARVASADPRVEGIFATLGASK